MNLAIAEELFYEVNTEEMQGLRAPEGHGYHSSLECQGLNRHAKQIDVKRLMSMHKVGLLSLLETKVRMSKMGTLYQNLCGTLLQTIVWWIMVELLWLSF